MTQQIAVRDAKGGKLPDGLVHTSETYLFLLGVRPSIFAEPKDATLWTSADDPRPKYIPPWPMKFLRESHMDTEIVKLIRVNGNQVSYVEFPNGITIRNALPMAFAMSKGDRVTGEIMVNQDTQLPIQPTTRATR